MVLYNVSYLEDCFMWLIRLVDLLLRTLFITKLSSRVTVNISPFSVCYYSDGSIIWLVKYMLLQTIK